MNSVNIIKSNQLGSDGNVLSSYTQIYNSNAFPGSNVNARIVRK